ncbi:MAG TPA: thioredoxin domain-containing protein [Pirellulales bacterium]|jgi:thiol-disulfide isomerase/thioredoxin
MLSLHSIVACLAVSGVGQTELIDFSASWCGPCRQMQPIVDALAAQGKPVRKVDIDQDKALAARFGVTSIPCFVMLVDGQEVDRVVGGTSRARLEQMLQLASRSRSSQPSGPSAAAGNAATFAGGSFLPPPAMPPAPAMRGQSPDAGISGPGRPSTFAPDAAVQGVSLPGQLSQQPLVTSDPTVGQGPHREALTAAGDAIARNNQAAEKCLASSVRLKVEDADGNSVGSGTIIDARAGEALVLTCGHIFRESKGNGNIFIDLFGPGSPKRVPGQLIGYDLKRDVGLVTFRPGVHVIVAKVAPTDYMVKRGDAVISVGCDNGREPSARVSHVASTDKYAPAPNIQVVGQPVEGRSGGGLFTAEGFVIGVCNAADPADNEGLYAGIGAIHGELTRKGLTEMIAAPTALPSRELPAMAQEMPAAGRPGAAPRVVPTSADDPRGPLAGQMGDAPLTPAERSLLEKIRSGAGDAEVVCIVRPLTDPHAMSEIVVVDHASPELLRQLSLEGHAQQARRLASIANKPAAATQNRPREILDAARSWQPNTVAPRFK